MKAQEWKTRISLLWVLMTLAILGQVLLSWSAAGFQRVFWFLDPARALEQTSGVLMGVAIFLLIPLVMAYLSVTLKALANRVVNLVLGIVYVGFIVANIVTSFSSASSLPLARVPTQPLGAQILLAFATLAAAVLIVVTVWMSPKRETQTIHI